MTGQFIVTMIFATMLSCYAHPATNHVIFANSLKNKCNPAMHTKKNWRTCCNILVQSEPQQAGALVFFFPTLFFLQNGYVEEERSHVLIYNMLNFCGAWHFVVVYSTPAPKEWLRKTGFSSKHWYTKSSLQFEQGSLKKGETRVSKKDKAQPSTTGCNKS